MKVLVVFGISLLIAFNTAAAREHRHCCSNSIQNVPASETCLSFKELVEKDIAALDTEHIKSKSMPEASKLKAWMKAFADAALECISNNRIFRNVHTAMDELHSIVEAFTPEYVLQKITEAHDYMDEHFNNLHAAQHTPIHRLSPGLFDRIEEFVKEHTKKAVEVFQDVRSIAETTFDGFLDGPLPHIFDVLVHSVNISLATDPTRHEEIFNRRGKVRSVAYDFIDIIQDQLAGKGRKVPPHHMIDRMILNFTAGVKELESLISDEFTEHKIYGTHRKE